MFGERLFSKRASVILSYRPNVIWRDRSYPIQETAVVTNVGAGNDAPFGAIPMFDERGVKIALPISRGANGPDVVRGQLCHGAESITAGVFDVGAGNDTPLAAVPVFCKRRITCAGAVTADGPGIIAGGARDAIKFIGRRPCWPNIRAGNDAPGAASIRGGRGMGGPPEALDEQDGDDEQGRASKQADSEFFHTIPLVCVDNKQQDVFSGRVRQGEPSVALMYPEWLAISFGFS